MNIKIETLVTKDSRSFEANNSKVYNQVYGASYSNNFPVSSVKLEEISVKDTEAAAFLLNLTELASDTTKISSIIAFCNQEVQSPADTATPLRFKTSLGGLTLELSQFSIVNCETADLSYISFSELQIPAGKKAILTIAITYR